jgi:hypothetical protein
MDRWRQPLLLFDVHSVTSLAGCFDFLFLSRCCVLNCVKRLGLGMTVSPAYLKLRGRMTTILILWYVRTSESCPKYPQPQKLKEITHQDLKR